MGKKVLISWDDKLQSYIMASPYNESFKVAWQSVIPSGARHWDPDRKLWFFNEQYGEAMQRVSVAIFGKEGVDFTSKDEVERRRAERGLVSGAANGLGKAAVAFLSLLSYDEARSAFRKAQLRLHTDVGGVHDKSAALNVAWDEIEKEIYKK